MGILKCWRRRHKAMSTTGSWSRTLFECLAPTRSWTWSWTANLRGVRAVRCRCPRYHNAVRRLVHHWDSCGWRSWSRGQRGASRSAYNGRNEKHAAPASQQGGMQRWRPTPDAMHWVAGKRFSGNRCRREKCGHPAVLPYEIIKARLCWAAFVTSASFYFSNLATNFWHLV